MTCLSQWNVVLKEDTDAAVNQQNDYGNKKTETNDSTPNNEYRHDFFLRLKQQLVSLLPRKLICYLKWSQSNHSSHHDVHITREREHLLICVGICDIYADTFTRYKWFLLKERFSNGEANLRQNSLVMIQMMLEYIFFFSQRKS